MFQDVEM